MSRRMKIAAFGTAVATAATVAIGVAVAPASSADVTIPDKHYVICDSATMYRNYDSAIPGPSGYVRTLYRDNLIGHNFGVHKVYNGWANIFDFGPNDWGYIRIECISK